MNRPQATVRIPKPQAVLWLAVVLSAIVGLGLLSVLASHQAFSAADIQIVRLVLSLDFPGIDAILGAANFLTSGPVAIALWFLAGIFFVLKGRPLEAVAVFFLGSLLVGDDILRRLVDRPLPGPEISSVFDFSVSASFPSGDVTGALAFYGLLSFLTLKNIRSTGLRVMVPVLSVLIIGLASVARVYGSAHWPSDVLGGYLFAFIGLMAITSLYSRIKEDRLHGPHLGRTQPAPEALNGITIAHSIASTVYLDPQAGTATKEYNPPWPVRHANVTAQIQYSAPFQVFGVHHCESLVQVRPAPAY